jgi:hypothetical protein
MGKDCRMGGDYWRPHWRGNTLVYGLAKALSQGPTMPANIAKLPELLGKA